MAEKMDVLVFGDQAVNTHIFLKEVLARGKSNTLFTSFIVKASTALREEVSKLPSLERGTIPNFSTITELADRYVERREANTAIESALLCISQLAHYIGYAEEDFSKGIEPSQTCIIGLCTGLLAAAAVASSPSPATLIPLAVEVVRIAFRTGLHVGSVAQRVHKDTDDRESWSYLVPETSELEARHAIEDFHKDKGTPVSSQAYVSAVSSRATTVSGPPSTLRQLFEDSDSFRETKQVRIPVYGPYHALHLHGNHPVQRIMSTKDRNTSEVIDLYHPKISILSTISGKWSTATTTRQLIEQMLHEILNETLRFDCILDGCVASLRASKSLVCRVLPIGPLISVHGIVSALKKVTDANVALENCSSWLSERSTRGLQASGSPKNSKLAIVGMAGRFPSAANHEKFWELLTKGLDVHREVPPDRFDVKTAFDPSGKKKNSSHTLFGCFIDDPGLFDPRFFNMSPREAAQTDPMQRLSLVTAYEALEMAGYVPNRTPSTQLDRVGTFYGQTSDDWREINAAQDVDTYFITGGVRAFGPGRINYHFKFSGPSYSVDTACSSGMAAVQLACTSLWAGECDTAIAGGVSVMTNSDIFSGLSRGQFLSKIGPCQTFDNDADGYCRADGVGTVIIKRLEDAEADKDNILAVILGSATNHSADAVSITHPHAETQETLYTKILNEAGIDPLDIDYVEMHGTGTQAGDGTEMTSVTNVFAPVSRKRSADQSLHLGAVKANVGHGEAASGITALIKVLLMMKKNAIPPHVGIKGKMNVNFPKDLDERNVHIAFENKPWKGRRGKKRRVFVNNFSAAGGNTGLLMEDASSYALGKKDIRTSQIIAVSGKAKSSLKKNIERLISYLNDNPDTSLPDLSYTLTARRIQHSYRLAFPVSDLAQAKSELAANVNSNINPVSSTPPKIVYAFTGQGSHYPSLAKELFEGVAQFRSDLFEFDSISRRLGFPSFLSLVDGTVTDVQSLSPLIVQLGITCIQMALSRIWLSWGIKPDIVVGHSLGEYAALNVAGVLSVSDTIFLVGERAQALEERCTSGTHAMLAVKSPISSIVNILGAFDEKVQVACKNAPQETVLSGLSDDIDTAASRLGERSIKCTRLNVPYAFHSSQVDPILASFEDIGGAAVFNKPKVPIISPLLGRVMSSSDKINPGYLSRHAREPVDFLGSIQSSYKNKIIDDSTVWIELGPHPVCIGMVKSVLGSQTFGAASLRKNESAWKTVSSSLCSLHTRGVKIDWAEYQHDFDDSHRLLDLPTYAFDDKNYWIQYTNDWCLTKGVVDNATPKLAIEEKSRLSTTTVQRIIQEDIKDGRATVTVESDLSHPELHAAVSGHLVNGSALCPSSIYGDMAMTVGNYIYKLLRPETEGIGLNVCKMEVFKPLIAKKTRDQPHYIQLTAKTSIALDHAELIFTSGESKTKTEHAKCIVEFGDREGWLAEWQRNAYLIQGRVDGLRVAEKTGNAHKILRGMAYKLFAALVNYDQKFRGMEEVILDSTQLEATAHIAFQTKDSDGNFFCSPYWIDSVAHLGGFIVNASDAVDSTNQVYVSHGWKSMQFARPLEATKTYRSYVKMQPGAQKMMIGDVYVFEENTIIGVVGGLKFQCIPRAVLNSLLPSNGVSASIAKPIQVLSAIDQSIPPAVVETKQTQVTVSKTTTKVAISVTSKTMDIIADEVGVSQDELPDAIEFSDLGVDSLMSLSISGRMREELEINVQSSIFVDYPTVGKLKTYLSQYDSAVSIEKMDFDTNAPDSGSTTPDLVTTIGTPESDGEEGPSTPSSQLHAGISNIVRHDSGVDFSMEESAIEILDEKQKTSLHGNHQSKSEINLPPPLVVDSASLRDFETVADIPDSGHHKSAPAKMTRLATSVLLQGSPRKASKTLFLIPDGGGSATSYIGIPEISPSVAVFGLNSPYMKTPEEYDIGVDGMATKFIDEIKRRQPQGPYYLGGWSAGGVIAFEAAQQLIRSGAVVNKLILIDTPCPLIIEPLPSSLHQFFNEIGLLGDGLRSEKKIPSWLLPHFAASVTALSTYNAKRMDPAKAPKTLAIWCKDGVCKNATDRRPDPYPYGHAEWLLENRDDFGPQLWDTFIGEGKIECTSIPGNHFTMMRDPNVQHLGSLIRDAVID